MVIMGSSLAILTISACGNNSSTESAAVENDQVDETSSGGLEESERIDEASANDETDNPENNELEMDDVSNDEEAEVEEEGVKYMLGEAELEEILEQYDNVLSVERSDGVMSVFGYTIPAGVERESEEWYGADGGKEGKSYDVLIRYGDEQHTAALVERISMEVFYNKKSFIEGEALDINDYNNQYKEALHQFMKEGVWEEPKRVEQSAYQNFFEYTAEMKKQGEIETPYRTAILYSRIVEGHFYTELDEEQMIYANPQHDYWQLYEGMLLEIDDYYVQIEYKIGDWWFKSETETELPDEFANHEYTGKLEEIIPQMFEVE